MGKTNGKVNMQTDAEAILACQSGKTEAYRFILSPDIDQEQIYMAIPGSDSPLSRHRGRGGLVYGGHLCGGHTGRIG